jgi:hypothetical protein
VKTPYCSQAKRADPRVPKSINPGMGLFNPKKWSLMNMREKGGKDNTDRFRKAYFCHRIARLTRQEL